MSSDSESDRNNGLITPKKTPKSTFKAPSNDRPKPIFIDEPKSFSTKKVNKHNITLRLRVNVKIFNSGKCN